jgi:hypothetical protein
MHSNDAELNFECGYSTAWYATLGVCTPPLFLNHPSHFSHPLRQLYYQQETDQETDQEALHCVHAKACVS